MVHDEKPSDVWWHSTDTEICRVLDKFRMDRFKMDDYLEVKDMISSIKTFYTQAKYLHAYQYGSGTITRSEIFQSERWYEEGTLKTDLLEYAYRSGYLARDQNVPDEEFEPVNTKFLVAVTALREHTRDNYLFDRMIEQRIDEKKKEEP